MRSWNTTGTNNGHAYLYISQENSTFLGKSIQNYVFFKISASCPLLDQGQLRPAYFNIFPPCPIKQIVCLVI